MSEDSEEKITITKKELSSALDKSRARPLPFPTFNLGYLPMEIEWPLLIKHLGFKVDK